MPDVVEDADTLEGNARLKAAAIVAATGEPAVADDTGLEVAALDGAPGVHTARFAGRGRHLRRQPAQAAVVARRCRRPAGPVPHRGHGRLAGRRASWPSRARATGRSPTAERGTAGFGYDAVFVPDEGDGRTFAEMGDDEKHALSARGRAFRGLVAQLAAR